MNINRAEFLAELESVAPGLSTREIIEQSSCFIFRRGRVQTFNDEIACTRRSAYAKSKKNPEGIYGAIHSAPLLAFLAQLPDETLEATVKEGEIVFRGKRDDVGIRMEDSITLQTEDVEEPGDWNALPEGFNEAIDLVQRCAGKDEKDKFYLTCVHLHPEKLEAVDGYHMAHYKMETPISQPTLVRRDSIKHVSGLGMVEIAESEKWLHFRNPVGMVMSCRRFAEDYPNLEKFIDKEGEPINLPPGLAETLGRSEIATAEKPDENEVVVDLLPGKIKVYGKGTLSWHKGRRKIAYDGKPITFVISPRLFAEVTKENHDCTICPDQLKIVSGNFTYVLSLGDPEETKQDAPQEGDDA